MYDEDHPQKTTNSPIGIVIFSQASGWTNCAHFFLGSVMTAISTVDAPLEGVPISSSEPEAFWAYRHDYWNLEASVIQLRQRIQSTSTKLIKKK